jgi:hypothetical protein
MFRPLGSGELICLEFCTGFGFLAARTFDDIEDDSAVVLLDVADDDLAGWSGFALLRCKLCID